MGDTIAFRRLGKAGDRALDRYDVLGKATVARGCCQTFDADAIGPEAEQMEGK
ncbi:MAG: hypothetical protein LCH80_10540 [Proteobacteria bacterium]|nr:hypothetical protein [Pseudomonadota bacterium]